jgi:hypothetical protein
MHSPADIVRQKRDCLDAADAERVRETALRFVEQLLTEGAYAGQLRAAVEDIAEAHPDVVADVLPQLDDHVVEALSAPDRHYPRTVARLALQLARIDPDAAPLIGGLLHEVVAVSADDWRVESFLIAIAGSNPAFLADELDVLLDAPQEHETVRTQRAWALARAYRLDPDSFGDPIAERRAALTGDVDPDRRVAALDDLGKVGIAAPEAVTAAVPDIVSLAEAGDESVRVAALEALGWIGGGEWWGGEWFGLSVDLDPAAFEALEAGVDAATPAVATTAAKAYVGAAAGDGRRRDRAVSHLFARLATADDDAVTSAVVTGLARLTGESDIVEAEAVERLLAVASASESDDSRATALRLLGRVDPSLGDRAAVERTLVAAMDAESNPVRRGAIDGAAGVCSRQSEPAPAIVNGLVEAATAGAATRQSAFRALGNAPTTDAVVDVLCAGLDDSSYADAAAGAACELGAEGVVATLVARLVDAHGGTDRPESVEADEYRYHSHLDDESEALLDALDEVTDRAPELLVPHAEALIGIVADASTPDGHALTRAVATLATRAPERVEPFAEQLTRRLDDARMADVGYLLDALLAVGSPDDRTLVRVVIETDADTLGVAGARLADRNPAHGLTLLSTLENDLRFRDFHHSVEQWIHELGDIATGDVRVSSAALDLCRLALNSGDDWIRSDGAAALARVAETHPERVVTERPTLRAALDDVDRHVPRGALAALGRVGTETDRSLVATFEAHPRPALRDAAAAALSEFDTEAAAADGPDPSGPHAVSSDWTPPADADAGRSSSRSATPTGTKEHGVRSSASRTRTAWTTRWWNSSGPTTW